jgi:hypothetical protein
MIEYFLKWLELVPLLNHTNERVVYAFKNKMYSQFGASTKILINQGIEFCDKFQQLCEKSSIHDPHNIS